MGYDTVQYRSLAGRVVLITGGASGIGADMVRGFTAQGSRVAFIDIDDAAAAALCAECPEAVYRHCDVTDIAALRACIAEIESSVGPIAALINNAARDDRHAMEVVEPEAWHRTLALNLDHQFFATQAIAGPMAARGAGSIIMMGSISWMRSRPGMVGYTTAKAAINGLAKTMARELGPSGIRVNCIVPGAILTERQATLWRTPEMNANIMNNQALKIDLDGSHVARIALFLASDESAGCTGANFMVDAGLS
jgi:NAD(P)-dependent dehydrogenase (short-subunit alcohol dehydrogenase family)